jgi:hypothetical protein
MLLVTTHKKFPLFHWLLGEMRIIGNLEKLRSDQPVQFLNNRSNGQNLSSTSGQAEFVAHSCAQFINKFLALDGTVILILPPAKLMQVNEGLNVVFLLVLYKNMTFLPTCDWSKFLGLSTNCGLLTRNVNSL